MNNNREAGMADNGITLLQVRAILHRWGEFIAEYGENSIDGWGWSPENALAQRRSGGSDGELTMGERLIDRLERQQLDEVSTMARLIKQLRPLRVAVLAHVYVNRLSMRDTALQLGAKAGWVIDVRRETEIELMRCLNGLRAVRFADTAKQALAARA